MSLLASLAAPLLRRTGHTLVSRVHAAQPFIAFPPKTSFDLVLLQRFGRPAGLRFIQIGANDGRRADPLLRYLEPLGWQGVMFEPAAANFAALSARHGANPRLRLRRAAVDLQPGRRELYDLSPAARAGLPDWAGGLASFDRPRVLAAARELGLPESAVVTEEIDTVGWDEVWASAGASPVDLLVLDTEGYDLTLLRAAGLARHRPRLVHFEHACHTVDDRLAFYRELVDLGYELATDAGDTTAWLPA